MMVGAVSLPPADPTRKECAPVRNKRTIPRTCQQCGNEFLARAFDVKRGKAKYCSNVCVTAAHGDLASRFWLRVHKTDDCWLWTSTLRRGYGRFWIAPGRFVPAHRFAYELLVGPIPEGLELDHLCRNPACVNPAHLDPVTHRENVRRGKRGATWRVRK